MIPEDAATELQNRPPSTVQVRDVCGACGADWQGVQGYWWREPDGGGDPGMYVLGTLCCDAYVVRKRKPFLTDEEDATEQLRNRFLSTRD